MFKKINNDLIPTGAAILTFDLIRRPTAIKLGWLNCKVEEYIPNPMRCITCQKLGHTKNHCNNAVTCKECCRPPPHEECSRIYCINCQEDNHTSYDPSCPTFLRHKSVNKIKSDRRCTLREAWQIYRDDPVLHQLPAPKKYPDAKPSMAEIIKNRILTKNQNPPQHPQSQHETVTTENQTSSSTSKSSQPPIPHRSNQTSIEKNIPQEKKPIAKSNSNNPITTTRTTIAPSLTTKTQNKPQNTSPSTSNSSLPSHSPLSTVTNALLKENNYYVNVMDTDDDQ